MGEIYALAIVAWFFTYMPEFGNVPVLVGPFPNRLACHEIQLPYRRLGFPMTGCALLAIPIEPGIGLEDIRGPEKEDEKL